MIKAWFGGSWLIVLLAISPAEAVPFDFSRPYDWDWREDGPILLLSTHAAELAGRITPLRGSQPFLTPFMFHVFLPPLDVGAEVMWGGFAQLQDGCEVGPFCSPVMRFTLVGERDGWALKGFSDALSPTPEPSSLLLLGTALVGLGWWQRRKR